MSEPIKLDHGTTRRRISLGAPLLGVLLTLGVTGTMLWFYGRLLKLELSPEFSGFISLGMLVVLVTAGAAIGLHIYLLYCLIRGKPISLKLRFPWRR